MDEVDRYLERTRLTSENILREVSDYDLYCEYIGADLEIGIKYSSPLREGDDDPSFVLYESKFKDALMFKDHADGRFGDVFDFIGQFLGIEGRYKICKQINSDLHLGFDGEEVPDFVPVVRKRVKVQREEVSIQVTSKEYSDEFLSYWDTLSIKQDVIKLYFAKDVALLHFITKSAHKTITPKDLCISYEILGFYKVYQPTGDRTYKFRNNYPPKFVEGALQLKFKSNFCIITKSMKECMFFRQHWDWDSVASTSENTMVSEYFVKNTLQKNYNKVFIWLDSDIPGIRAQQKYIEKYPWMIPIRDKKFPEYKDPTDLYYGAKQEGWEVEALYHIFSLITTRL
tara:strand:+ start:1096 stop:2121 length:1026 start_codon:yes stop_codon:yes gene_type:complete